MMTEFYCKLARQVVGPFSGVELREAALAGIVDQETPLSQSPDGQWVPARSANNLFDSDGRVLPHPAGTPIPTWYLRGASGDVGPIGLAQLLHKLRLQAMRPADRVRREGTEVWIPCDQVSSFAKHLDCGKRRQPTCVSRSGASEKIDEDEILAILGEPSPRIGEDTQLNDVVDEPLAESDEVCPADVDGTDDFTRPLNILSMASQEETSVPPLELIMEDAGLLKGGTRYLLQVLPERLVLRQLPKRDSGSISDNNTVVLTRGEAVAYVKMSRVDSDHIVVRLPGRKRLVLQHDGQNPNYDSIRKRIQEWLKGQPFRPYFAPVSESTNEPLSEDTIVTLKLLAMVLSVACCFLVTAGVIYLYPGAKEYALGIAAAVGATVYNALKVAFGIIDPAPEPYDS